MLSARTHSAQAHPARARSARVPPASVLAAVLLLLAGGARAQDSMLRGSAGTEVVAAASPRPKLLPEILSDAIGSWELSQDGTGRTCRLTLSGESGPDGRRLEVPGECRRTLPVLAKAAGWLFLNAGIRIVDADIRPLIDFAPAPDGRAMQGRGARGEAYGLVPIEIIGRQEAPQARQAIASSPGGIPGLSVAPPAPPRIRGSALAQPGAAVPAIPGSQPMLRADVLVPPGQTRPVEAAPARTDAGGSEEAGPGVYALDRFGDKDVCRIALERRPAAPGAAGGDPRGQAPAHLLPGCRDGGIAVFDPIAWRFAAGHLTLKAKRGHSVNLVATGDGRWRRDPEVGATFVLRRVE